MSKEAISRVLKAEEEAATIRAGAEAEARARSEENRQACAAEADAQIQATARALKHKLDDVRGKTELLIQRSREEAEEDAKALEAEAEEKMREAVRIITWEMFDSCQ